MLKINNNLKTIFLETLDNPQTKRSLLKRLEPYEIQLEKDLLYFSEEEMKEAIKMLNLKSEVSVATTLSHLRSYFKWGISEGYISKDPISTFVHSDLKELINGYEAKEQFLYIEDILKLKETLINPQDLAALILIWNGIDKDNKWYALRAILNININQIDRSIRYFINGIEKHLYLSKEDFKIIEQAQQQIIYTSSATNKKFELEETQFLFKVKPRKNKSSDIIGYNVIYDRLCTALEDAGYPSLTLNNIQASSILYRMNQLEAVTAPSVVRIIESFGLSGSPGNLNNYLKLYKQAYGKE